MRSHDPDHMSTVPLASFPPVDEWDDWMEYDAAAWPKKVERKYMLVPTTCFNCEAACGLMAYVDKATMQVRRLEGNPHHPGSRGKNCAKGPATINQINDPERILYPLKRSGPRGSGRFERTTWDEVLDTFAARIRRALLENRRNEIMYHVGRPGEDGFMLRVLQSWGVDAHNSPTNVCSSAARPGYALWSGADRPPPDHQNAKFRPLMSSHPEPGPLFTPHAPRRLEAGRPRSGRSQTAAPGAATSAAAGHSSPGWRPGSQSTGLMWRSPAGCNISRLSRWIQAHHSPSAARRIAPSSDDRLE